MRTAFVYYSSAAKHGDAWAQAALGKMYLSGIGVRRDDALAFAYYQRAAGARQPQAETILAILYAQGIGVGRDLRAAEKWYALAAAGGDSSSQFSLGCFKLKSARDPGTRAAALALLREAASRGEARAQRLLGDAMIAGRVEADGYDLPCSFDVPRTARTVAADVPGALEKLAPARIDAARLAADVRELYISLAAATDDDSNCDALDKWQAKLAQDSAPDRGGTWANRCKDHAENLRLVRALVERDPRARAVCRELARRSAASRRSSGDADTMCREAVDPSASAEMVCSHDDDPKRRRDCVAMMSAARGDASHCDHSNPARVDECRGFALFARLHRRPDGRGCAGNRTCLILDGDGLPLAAEAARGVLVDAASAESNATDSASAVR